MTLQHKVEKNEKDKFDDAIKIDQCAFHGLPGDVCKAIGPHSEASEVALLVQLLCALGNMVGRNPHILIEGTRHHLKLFVVIVGASSKSRKGTAWNHVINFCRMIEPNWVDNCVKSGLSSGEGIVHHLRDEGENDSDKRFLAIEQELSAVLIQGQRKGNTLSTFIRQAWDDNTLQLLTKNTPSRASNTHISVVAHSTEYELLNLLTKTDTFNGFANRFLWASVHRSKFLPFGGQCSKDVLERLADEFKLAIEFSRGVNQIFLNHEAKNLWANIYQALSRESTGAVDNLTARSEAYVLRLAGIYALMDSSKTIKPIHLKAAYALWKYCEMSVFRLWGPKQKNNKDYQKLKTAIENSSNGMSKTEINQLFQGNKKSEDIDTLLETLKKAELIFCRTSQSNKGRNKETWFPIGDFSVV